ncbi:putative baseplate assembly protein [Nocardia gipuzkoensis]
MTTRDGECGCCAGPTASTPRELQQRHGLPVIAYRVGTYPDFLASLGAALSDANLPALAKLRSRDQRDFTMALLDGVATLCDVLTFYTERLAQESYLSTATDRTSLQELGRLVAYRLRPGVASATHVAFFVQPPPATPTATGAPEEAFAAGPYLPAGGMRMPAGLAVRSVPGPGELPQTFETTATVTARPEWNALRVWATRPTVLSVGDGRSRAYLIGTGHRLKPGDRLLFTDSGGGWATRTVKDATEQPADERTLLTWTPPLKTGDVTGDAGLYVFRKRLGIFGHNAPPLSLIYPDNTTEDWAFDLGDGKNDIDLDGSHPDILVGSHVLLQRRGKRTPATVEAVREGSRSGYAISSRITSVRVDTDVDEYDEFVRDTIVHAASEPLPLAQQPDDNPLTGQFVTVEGSVELPTGRGLLLVGADPDGGPASELVTIARTTNTATSTTIHLTAALTHRYRRDTAVLYGNVVAATHGETVHQVLGSGDGAAQHQRFALERAPLTYVPSTDPTGATSTLRIRVNDVEWHEVSTFFQTGPAERSFVIRDTVEGGVTVVFGDGVQGSRLPTGLNNVRAEYRTGIGVAGNITAGAISQIMDPPLGVTKVTNPQPAAGGADPEPVGTARQAIPLSTRTLGRAVSLLDYADYAHGFAGITKADAAVLTLVGGRTIVVTVAGPDGTEVPAGTRARLVSSLRTFGDPTVSVLVLPHRAASFRLSLRFKRDPDYLPAVVTAAIRAQVAQVFSFATREFGQPVHRSEVAAAIHHVPGVIAVDLDKLYRVKPPIPPEPGWPKPVKVPHRLLAARPRTTAAGLPLAAELLAIADGDPFDKLREMP